MKTPVRQCQPDDQSGLHDLFSALVVGRVPHCWPVPPSTLEAMLGEGEVERDGVRLLEQAVLVAGAGGEGFVHVGRQAVHKGQDHEVGVIRFLACRRGERAAGDALLEAAESWMRERGLRQSTVMPQVWRYPFYGFPHAYLSDRLDHVQALVRFRGYTRTGGEVFLDWPEMQPEAPTPPDGLEFDLRVEDRPGAGRRPGLRLQALRDGEGIGECVLVSGGDSSPSADEAHDFAFCDWLGVNDNHQGQGLGRYLLAQAMYLARERGYRHGAISTALSNDRAFLFYTNHGFQVVDWTYEFSRELS